jgi:hypothetical protein
MNTDSVLATVSDGMVPTNSSDKTILCDSQTWEDVKERGYT